MTAKEIFEKAKARNGRVLLMIRADGGLAVGSIQITQTQLENVINADANFELDIDLSFPMNIYLDFKPKA